MTTLVLFLAFLQTPNVGGVFTPRPQNRPEDPHQVVAALMRYHEAERDLFAQKTLPTKKIIAHWNKLRPMRRAVERMIARGQVEKLTPNERGEMRRALHQVLEHSVELVYVAASEIDARMFDADEERTVELLRLALLANRWFGLEVQEIFGIPVEPGVS
jgi:hypothetical protein